MSEAQRVVKLEEVKGYLLQGILGLIWRGYVVASLRYDWPPKRVTSVGLALRARCQSLIAGLKPHHGLMYCYTPRVPLSLVRRYYLRRSPKLFSELTYYNSNADRP